MKLTDFLKVTINHNDSEIKIEFVSGYPESFSITSTGVGIKLVAPDGTVIYDNLGSSDIVIYGDYLTVALPSDADGYPALGDYEVSAGVNTKIAAPYKTYVTTFSYCFVLPTPDIEMSYDCLATYMKVDDNTDYKVLCNDSYISPSAIVRNGKLQPPQDTEPGTTLTLIEWTGDTYTTSDLWTHIYGTQITTSLTYQCVCGENDATGVVEEMLYVEAEVVGTENIEVECADCMCNYNSCMRSLYYQYVAAKESGSDREEKILAKVLLEVEALTTLYINALRCGLDDAETYCTRIKTLLDYTGTNCCTEDDDGYSTQVTGIYGGAGGSVTGNEIYVDSLSGSSPADGSFTDGDIYIDTDAPNKLWKYNDGWVLQTTLQGDTGDSVESGVVYSCDYTETDLTTPGVTTEHTPVSIPVSVIGDRGTIRMTWQVKGNASGGSYVGFSIGGEDAPYDIDQPSTGSVMTEPNFYVNVCAEVSKITDSRYGIRINADYSGNINVDEVEYWRGDITPVFTITPSTFVGVGSDVTVTYMGYDAVFNDKN